MNLSQNEFDNFCSSWLLEDNINGRGKLREFITDCEGRLTSKLEFLKQDNNFAVYSIKNSQKLFPSGQSAKWLVVWVPEGTSSEAAETYTKMKSNLDPSERAVISIIGDSSNIRVYLKTLLVPAVLLDDEKIRIFLFEPNPSRFLQQEITGQIGLEILNPYDASAPVSEQMFVNRDTELKQITSPQNRGVAVVGQRGIGKSSLLQKAFRDLQKEERLRPFYMSCEVYRSYEALNEHLMNLLHPKDKERGRYYDLNICLLRAKSSKSQVVLLLDDADVLVQYCQDIGNWKLFEHLHNPITQKACRVILAGYKELQHALFKKDNLLKRLLEMRELKALSEDDASRLILKPTAELGITFENSEIVTHIVDWTSCHPSYLQLYMKLLVQRMASNGRRDITFADTKAIEKSDEFYKSLIGTFRYDTTLLEKCIVYVVLLERGEFEPTEIQERLKQRQYEPGIDPIARACEDLVLANIFTRLGRNYAFLFKGLTEIIESNQNPEEMLRSYIKDSRRELNA